MSTSAWARGPLELSYSDPAFQSEPALQQFLRDLEESLPDSLKQQLGGKVRIRFSRLPSGKGKGLAAPTCSKEESAPREGDVHGSVEKIVYGSSNAWTARFKTREITLNSGFLTEIRKGRHGSREYPCGHRNFYRLALGTAIHELGHIYDIVNSPIPTAAGGGSESDWPFEAIGGANERRPQRSVSDRPAYLALTGFGMGLASILPRSPDAYEYTNPSESFAVNLEYFLLDPEYACRRPTFHSFFSRHFDFVPPSGDCRVNTQARLASFNPDENVTVELDPERVYQVHYLLADKGEETASRWGHAMYRLALCAPGRELGPDCLKDVSHHVVVSYRANIAGLTFSSVGALLGQYPSQMFLLRFLDTISEYTRGEMRDVVSTPLKLDRGQVRAFMLRALEQHWQYADRYYFVTKNCATESLGFIQGALNEHPIAAVSPGIMLPKKLANLLDEQGLLDRRNARLFPSILRGAGISYEALQAAGIARGLTLREFVENGTAAERLAYFDSTARRGALAPHFIAIEMLARTRLKQLMTQEAMTWLRDHGEEAESPRIRRLNQLQNSLMPWNLTKRGYGIAQPADLVAPAEIQALSVEMAELLHGSLQLFERPLAARREQLRAIGENILKFLSEGREMSPKTQLNP
ncbi:MAG: DUF4105 domain-containing protein [Oligoflexia bacterium]|nr:DUF4105 domain-containing protein [Oligoflexia bacterium]